MPHRTHNFSAGPAALPLPVLESAQANLVNFAGSGMSLMEMSHRGPIYDEVHNQCIADLRTLLGISEDYDVLFMGGGARTQFALIPMNLLPAEQRAAYIDTGTWASGALREAGKLGQGELLWSSKESTYDHVPTDTDWNLQGDECYLHYTSNNTIYGTQFNHVPETDGVDLICDMSSDILSRPVDVNRFALIYAGAQKNMGPAGVTLVIVRKDLLQRCSDTLPEVMNYRLVAAKNSMLNTPPVFPIYMVGLVARHLIELGGLEAVAANNRSKAGGLYSAIDNSDGFYRGHSRENSRSEMNVTFRTQSAELDKQFVEEAAAAGLSGLKGHRSVGGLRASIYNAVPLESVHTLVEFMGDFQRRHSAK